MELWSSLVRSRSVASGAMLYIAMRWFDRLIGVISTIILARLLTPDDFGVVALASAVLGLATVMLDLGINITVVQRQGLDQADIDTAWTLQLIQNAAIAALLVVPAGSIAAYYDEPRLQSVMIVLGLAYVLSGLTGMGPVIFQKEQQYAREVAFFMMKRSGGFIVTILLAVLLRSYWALVVGTVVGNALSVYLSYAMHRVPPRLTLTRWRSFLGASFWLTLRGIGWYAFNHLDKFVIGRRDGTAMLGAYSIADQISAMPTSELLAPMSRALFPAMAAIQDDLTRLRQAFLYALGIQASLALPASIGLALVAHELVIVMLGEKWGEAVPVMVALALSYGAFAFLHAASYLLMSMGKLRAQTIVQLAAATSLALLVFVVFPSSDAEQIAWFRAVSGAGLVGAVIWLTIHYLPAVSVVDILRVVARPLLASLIMALLVVWLGAYSATLAAWQQLAVKVLCGVVGYSAALAGLWFMTGRPDGAERWMLDRARAVF